MEWEPYLNRRSMCYAGIGSRKAPPDVLRKMKKIAERLAARSYTLRSCAAEGSDTAFEQGCGSHEIFLPWPGFNGSSSPFENPSAAAIADGVPAIRPNVVDLKGYFELRKWDLTKSLDPMSGHLYSTPALRFQADRPPL